MKHFKLLFTVAVLAVLATWTFGTIEVQTTTPKVNPDGNRELVGQMRLIFSAKEFVQQPPDQDTAFSVVVRVQLTLNKKLMTVGGMTQSAFVPINLVWEQDAGNFNFVGVEQFSSRILKFYSGDTGTGANSYVDILFTDDMKNWGNLDAQNKVRVTVGAPAFTSIANPSGTAYAQANTQFCVDFTPLPDEFAYRDLWPVGMDCHVGTDFNVGAPYPVNFQPATPDLAQKGSPTANCKLTPWWPGKSDPCKPAAEANYAQSPANAQYCYVPPSQTPPCADNSDDWWLDFCRDDFEYPDAGHHWFAVKEDACPSGRWLFYPGGVLTITLNDNELDPVFDWDPYNWYCLSSQGNMFQVWAIWGSGSSITRVQITTGITYDSTTITIPLPATLYGSLTHPTGAVCFAIRLPAIRYNYCPMLSRLDTENVPFVITISYTNQAGCSSATSVNWTVGYAWGCLAGPQQYTLALYYPYIPPVNLSGIAAYLAVTNYATQPTDDGEIHFWTNEGTGFIWKPSWTATTPLGGHQQWILDLTSTAFKNNVKPASSSQADKTFGAKNMSAILYMQVTDPTYPFLSGGFEDGSVANIDSFVWIVVGDTAQGYLARTLQSPYGWYQAPLWQKQPRQR